MPLLVSLHDVAPPHLPVLRPLRARLARWGVARATLLVVPNHHGRAPLEGDPETVTWLRRQLAAGDEAALHGYYHRQQGRVRPLGDRVRAALWTAGEGECLAQTAEDRAHMLDEGKRQLERALGAPVLGFVAPAWLEPAGFAEPLARAGFRWHEGALWVDHRTGAHPSRPWRRRRCPVIGFATRSPARRLASLGWASVLAPALAALARRLPDLPVRVALHPADAGCAPVMERLEQVVHTLTALMPARTYAEALGAGGS
jgi:predicted deacetylase